MKDSAFIFSIIIPTYNRAQSISRAIDSVLKQRFRDFELIVIDDGSTDDTGSLLQDTYGSKLIYEVQDNAGVCAARNRGAGMAKGKYLIFLDSDDYLSDNALQHFHQLLSNSPIKLLLGYSYFITDQNVVTQKILPVKNGTHYEHPLTGAYVIERVLFLQQGGYDERLSFSETSDFFLRLSLENKIAENELAITTEAGVLIQQADRKERIQRYSLRKYESVKYFLRKHSDFFGKNPKHFLNFKRIHGICALQNRMYSEARKCFWEVLKITPWSLKSHFHFYFVTFAPGLARRYYAR